MNLAYWKEDSPAGRERRIGLYLFEMLKRIHRTSVFTGEEWTEYPAVWGYDSEQDQPLWVEIKAPVHARDYRCAFKDRMNKAALALAEVA
jgi:hypothetical protein